MNCKLCGKTLPNRRSLSGHYTRIHKLNDDIYKESLIVNTLYGEDNVKYYTEQYLSGNFSISCLPIDISKYLKLLGLKRTSSEERKTARYKEKYLKAIRDKYGDGITNVTQVPEVMDRVKKSLSVGHPSYEDYLKGQRKLMEVGFENYVKSGGAKETYKKTSKTCSERYGVDNPSKLGQIRRKLSDSQKKRISLMSTDERKNLTREARKHITQRGGFSSSLEDRVCKILSENKILFERNKKVGEYICDIVSENIILEVFGTYWHLDPRKFDDNFIRFDGKVAKNVWESDKNRIDKLTIMGYTVIVLWEEDIKLLDDSEIYNYILERINEYSKESCV